jgi:hypothetical protein
MSLRKSSIVKLHGGVFKPQNIEQGISNIEVSPASAVRNSLFDILNFKYFSLGFSSWLLAPGSWLLSIK